MAYRRYTKKKTVRRGRKGRMSKTAYKPRKRIGTRKAKSMNRALIVRKQFIPGVITGSAGGIVDLFQNSTYSAALTNYNDQYDLNALAGQFEQMKCYKLILELEPLQSEAVQSLPNGYVRKVIDNQQTAYTTEAEYLKNLDCKSYPVIGRRTTRHIIYPKMSLNETYGSTTVTRPRNPGWFNTSQGSVSALVFSMYPPHIFIPPMTAGVSLFNVKMTAVIGFKGNK